MSRRFLHFSPITPAPHGNGLAMRTSMYCEALGKVGSVDVVVIGPPPSSEMEWRCKGVSVQHIPVEGRLDTRLRLISKIADTVARVDALRAYGRPFTSISLSAPVMAEAGKIASSEPWSAILLSRAQLLPLLNVLPRPASAPVIVDLDDDDATHWREWGSLDTGGEARAWLEAEADIVERLIASSSERIAVFTCASEPVAQALRSRLSLDKVVVIPNGIDTSQLEQKPSLNKTLIFVGNLSYEPNIDGVIWFTSTVFPLIRSRVNEARLVVAGSSPSEAVTTACMSPGITIYPDVPDVARLYQDASVSIVPLRFGSGSRIKILEAAVHGLPVVSTSKGAQGLGPELQDAIFLSKEGSMEFASACLDCLNNSQASLARAAQLQMLVAKHHSRADIVSRIQHLVTRQIGS